MTKRVCWITWEDHRRSIELAKQLGADYYYVRSTETFVLRHIIKAIKTVTVIYQYRDGLVVVQNPSRVLAALAAFMKLIFRFPLIVDRHTNFRLGKSFSMNPAIWFVILCSEFSIRMADLTIVTNEFLKCLVEKKGGRSCILHDRIPEIKPPTTKLSLPKGTNVLFVCTYAPDEPYKEVIAAARLIPNDCHIHITGNYAKAGLIPDSSEVPANIHLLGFVSDDDYAAYLFSCEVIMVLTTSEWVIVCGGYEAAAAGKPLITSNTDTLSEFYQGNAYLTKPTPESIAEAISEVASRAEVYTERMYKFSELEKKTWERQWFGFLKTISTL